MFCSKCGQQNQDGVKFCSNCGQLLETSAEQVASYTQPAPPPQKQDKKKGIIIGAVIGAVVLVLIVVGVLVAVLNGGDDKDDVKPNTKVEETVNSDDKETTTEASKGDENHDGRLIGIWTGSEKGTVDIGYGDCEMEIKCSYQFNDDGIYITDVDEDSYKEALRSLFYQSFEAEGYTKEETDAAFVGAYGMTMDELVEQHIEDAGSLESAGVWETEDGVLVLTSEYERESCTYSFSADGNTLYIIFEDGSKGEFTRAE